MRYSQYKTSRGFEIIENDQSWWKEKILPIRGLGRTDFVHKGRIIFTNQEENHNKFYVVDRVDFNEAGLTKSLLVSSYGRIENASLYTLPPGNVTPVMRHQVRNAVAKVIETRSKHGYVVESPITIQMG